MSYYGNDNPTFLEEAFQSIQNQTHKPSEIILVQDGPVTEELHQVVSKWKEALPLKLLVNADNLGLGKSLTIGLEHCENDLVARMDADDICHPRRFEKQLDFLMTHPHISVVGTWIAEFEGTTSNIKSYRTLPTTHEELLPFSKKRCPLNHPTVMYRKEH